jgi:aspartyl-tRNA(Asn)/glutamyl-tRNA(Gln) amidotransferase subunit C
MVKEESWIAPGPGRKVETMAMKFSENADRMDVRYVAGLARMALSDAETAQLQGQLDDILAFVGELKSLDVSGVAATDDASGNRNAWREDEPLAGLSREAALANAPLARHGQFAVPKVIE